MARSTPWCLEGRSLCVNISVRPGKCEIQSDSGNLREIAVLIPVMYMFIFLWSKRNYLNSASFLHMFEAAGNEMEKMEP